jgi:peptidoglycan-N-acetylglucosamine deacetylase
VTAALALTVDVDGEAGLPGGGRDYEQRLSSRSERAYGLARGLPRILAVLEELDVAATFYVLGVVAERHRDEVAAIVERGHELGHHGHTHRAPHRLSRADQRSEIERGISALAPFGGAVRGYRAPGWELTEVTLDALLDHGFRHDSSLMGDDRPYAVVVGQRSLVELPVHWSLDDAPYFAAGADPDGLLRVWLRELELAAMERRPITLTLHPEILGRPHRLDVLRRSLEHAAALGMQTVTHGALAGATRPRPPAP